MSVPAQSWISPKTAKGRPSKIHGKGFFAVKPIAKGEVVAVKGGCIIDGATLEKNRAVIRNSESQIADDLYIAALTPEEVEQSMVYINHSCEPNTYVHGDLTCIANRDIKAGEELTCDYATYISENSASFTCNCEAANCRHYITGNDWQKPELQAKYGDYFSAYLLRKIRAQSKQPAPAG